MLYNDWREEGQPPAGAQVDVAAQAVLVTAAPGPGQEGGIGAPGAGHPVGPAICL
jgi:hypothetical protein